MIREGGILFLVFTGRNFPIIGVIELEEPFTKLLTSTSRSNIFCPEHKLVIQVMKVRAFLRNYFRKSSGSNRREQLTV
jgi:hypothetical protein